MPKTCTLDTSAQNLFDMARADEAHRDKYIKSFPDLIQTLAGSYFRSDMKPVNPSPENFPFTFIANVRPRLVFSNPKVVVNSDTAAIDPKQCVYIAKFLNRWIHQENFVNFLRPFVTQGLLLWAVALTSFDETEQSDTADLPPGELVAMMPHVHLLEPHRFFKDSASTPATPPRTKGHVWVRDLEAVKKMKDVDPKTAESLIPDVELKRLQRPNSKQGGGPEMPTRLEIVGYEIWVAECNDYRTGDGRGQNGTIFTVACGQSIDARGNSKTGKVGYLRPPRPFYGPPWGPYTELGYFDVPGHTYASSPINVFMQQIEEVNSHLAATAESAARMKQLVLVDASQDTLQFAIQNSPDGTVVGIPGLSKDQVIPMALGGPSKEQYAYNIDARDRLQRNMGQSSAQTGEPEAGVTATADNTANMNTNVRMQDLKAVTTGAVRQILNTVAWYGHESNNVSMALPPSDGEDVGIKNSKNPRFYGGPRDGEQLPPWDSEALDIEPYSMEAVDEEVLARQVGEALAVVAEIVQLMQEAPWLGYDEILEQLAKLRKFDWLPKTINGELFAEWMQEQVQQGLEKHQTEQAFQQAQIEGMQIANAKMKLEMMLMAKEAQGGGQEAGEKKPPSVAISYKDLPEDMKRTAEQEAFGRSSTQPLTSPAHVAGAMDLHKTAASQQHDLTKQGRDQQHQARQNKENRLAAAFKQMGANKPKRGKVPSGASSGRKAFASSK